MFYWGTAIASIFSIIFVGLSYEKGEKQCTLRNHVDVFK